MTKYKFLFLLLSLYFFLPSNAQNKHQLSLQSKFGIPIFEEEKAYLKEGGINLTQGLDYQVRLNEKNALSGGILLDLEFGKDYRSRSIAFPFRFHYYYQKLIFSAGLVITKHDKIQDGGNILGGKESALVYNNTGQAHWTNTHVATSTIKLEKKFNRQIILGGHYQISPQLNLDLEFRIYTTENKILGSQYMKGIPFANTLSIGASYSFDAQNIF